METFIGLVAFCLIVYFIFKILLYDSIIKPFLDAFRKKPTKTKVIIETEDEEDKADIIPSTTQVSAKLSPELYKKLNGFCDYKGISKTSVINEAVEMYLKDRE